MMGLLLERGADLEATDSEGLTALQRTRTLLESRHESMREG